MADLRSPLLIPAGNFEELESNFSAMQVFFSQVVNNVAALRGSVALTPVGAVTDFAGATAPSGWLLCDGSAISRTTYAALFAVISTTYGVGDGSSTFNLPDARQRFTLGKAASGTGSTLGSTGGAIDHTHSGGSVSGSTGSTAPGTDSQGSHNHGGATGGHTHTGTTNAAPLITHVNVTYGGPDNSVTAAHTHTFTSDSATASISSDGSHSHTVNSHTHAAGTLAVGTSGTANPPYIAFNKIIFSGV